MKRYGQIIRVLPEKLEEYKELHKNVWPDVLEQIHRSNIRNYTIYYNDGLLFSYYEYIGDDYEKDMEAMAADKTTQEWWKLTSPCQAPLDTAPPGEFYRIAEEVFHTD